jgi:cleavage and polyadenylation specificity factor subunit 3
MAAELPSVRIDVLITESTYGVQSHEPRLEKEARFTGNSLRYQLMNSEFDQY